MYIDIYIALSILVISQHTQPGLHLICEALAVSTVLMRINRCYLGILGPPHAHDSQCADALDHSDRSATAARSGSILAPVKRFTSSPAL